MVTPDEIREVLRALHAAATHRDDDDVPCEERGLAWGPPAWHEGVALWARVLAITEDRRIAEHLKTAFGKDTRLKDLTAGRISAYRERRLAATSERRKDAQGNATPLSAASINRPLALLRHLLRLARDEWG